MESFKSGEVTCAFSERSSNARAIGAPDAPLQAFRHARFDRTFQTSLPLKMSPPSCPGQVVLLHGLLGEGLQKISYITRPIVTLAIDKERRRPVYAASYAALEILSNPECVNARSDFPN